MKENIIAFTEFLQENPDRIQEVMDHFPSINYNNDVKWAIATVKMSVVVKLINWR